MGYESYDSGDCKHSWGYWVADGYDIVVNGGNMEEEFVDCGDRVWSDCNGSSGNSGGDDNGGGNDNDDNNGGGNNDGDDNNNNNGGGNNNNGGGGNNNNGGGGNDNNGGGNNDRDPDITPSPRPSIPSIITTSTTITPPKPPISSWRADTGENLRRQSGRPRRSGVGKPICH